MSKILSIIIPSYNMEKYLNQCLDSLLISSIDLIEVMIINDGSKDKTSEIAHKYASRYPESIKVIDKKNGNYGSCINQGIKEAKGKYVKVLDADDSFYKHNFERFVMFLTHTDADLIISDYDIVNEDGAVTREIRFDQYLSRDIQDFDSKILSIPVGQFQMHAVTYRVSNLKEMNYRQTEGMSYTDQEWMFMPMSGIKTYAFFNLPVYRYLVGRAGQTIMEDQSKHWLPVTCLVRKMIPEYKNIAEGLKEIHGQYLKSRLAWLVASIYRNSLLYNSGQDLFENAKKLDLFLLENLPEILVAADKDRIKSYIPVAYVKKWRNNNYDPQTMSIRVIRKLLHNYHR